MNARLAMLAIFPLDAAGALAAGFAGVGRVEAALAQRVSLAQWLWYSVWHFSSVKQALSATSEHYWWCSVVHFSS